MFTGKPAVESGFSFLFVCNLIKPKSLESVKGFKSPFFNLPALLPLFVYNFDLEFGKVRYRSSGAAGGNNGLKSLDAALDTSNYARIRVGTWNDELRRKMGDIDFVLSKFTPEEKEQLPEILREVCDKIDEFVQKK